MSFFSTSLDFSVYTKYYTLSVRGIYFFLVFYFIEIKWFRN